LSKVRGRIQKGAPLTHEEKSQAIKGDLGAMFANAIQKGKEEQKAASLPSDLRRELFALPGPKIASATKKGATDLMMDDISRIMRGSLPQHLEIASAGDEGGIRARTKQRDVGSQLQSALGFNTLQKKGLGKNPDILERKADRKLFDLDQDIKKASGKERDALIQQRDKLKNALENFNKGQTQATGNTVWARSDAGDFDKSFKIYKRIRGDKDMIDWDETVKNGKKIGEGSFGTVLRVGDVAHKRGEIGADEANIIKRIGEAGLGPRLLGAEISTKKRDGYGVDLHNGRIAMTVVPGKEMGNVKPDTKLGGNTAADIYWKSMADLHRLGIAHNDAHPHNILVDDKGKGRWVDMGLAQQSPRAALAEAMGVFKHLKGGDDITVHQSAAGNGNWQSRDWKTTNIKEADRAKQAGGQTWAEYKQKYPVMGKMWDNQDKVIQNLQKSGLDINEINSMIEHGIRSSLPSYDRSDGFSRVSDKKAQELLNILYDGI
jgi:hypothetical protein